MFVIVHHQISDPQKFWGDPEGFFASIPTGLKVHAGYPSADLKRATILWECDDLPHLRAFVDEITTGMAKNEYLRVDEGKAVGLPPRSFYKGAEHPPAL
jgi:hypothetical protein